MKNLLKILCAVFALTASAVEFGDIAADYPLYLANDPFAIGLARTNAAVKVNISAGASTNQTLMTATVPTFLSFTTNAVGALSAGQISWDSDWRTFKLGLGNGVQGQAFQEGHVLVKNVSGQTITNGMAVMHSGAVGNSGKYEATLAVATVGMRKGSVIGIATEDIPIGGVGRVTKFGNVNAIGSDGSLYGASGWLDNTPVYVSHTVAGFLVTNAPPAPYSAVQVGNVINAHTSGAIYVDVRCGLAMKDLDDVDGTPLTVSGQFPVWDNVRQVFDFTGNTGGFVSAEADAKFATNAIYIVRDGVVKGFYGTNLYAAAEAAVSGDKITLSAGDYHIYQRGITLADGVSMSGAGSGVSRIIETGMNAFTVGGTVSRSVVRVGSDSVLENVGVICDWSEFGDTRFIFGIGAFVETNVTIRNCYIRGASDAVYFKGTRGATVERCDIETAFDGVMFFTDEYTGTGSDGRLSWSRVRAVAMWPTNEYFQGTGCAAAAAADGSTGVVSFCELSAVGGDAQNIGIKVTAAGHGESYNNTIYVRDAGKSGEGWETLTHGLLTEGGYLSECATYYGTSSGTITHMTPPGLASASVFSFTNGTTMADGLYNGTNSVIFRTAAGTNYVLRLW